MYVYTVCNVDCKMYEMLYITQSFDKADDFVKEYIKDAETKLKKWSIEHNGKPINEFLYKDVEEIETGYAFPTHKWIWKRDCGDAIVIDKYEVD